MKAPRLRRLIGLAGLCTVAALTTACALLPQPTQDAAKAEAPAARLPAIRLEVLAPGPLKALLEQYLDLARLKDLPAEDALSEAEWARLIASAPAQARELLQTEGYFDAQVQVQRVGAAPSSATGAGQEAPDATAAAPERPNTATAAAPAATPVVRVVVDPGPRTRVGHLAVDSQGEVARRAETGDRDALALRKGLANASVLQPGLAFRNPDWSDSKQAVLARLRAGGYAAASLAGSVAAVDTSQQRADLSITATSGPLFKAGEVQITGLKRQDAQTVRHLAGFGPGAALTEGRLLDYQERLQKSNLFQSASVSFEPDPALAEATPVQVRVSEAPLQQATVGVGFSGNTGPRATLEHTHRRPLDYPVVAYNKLEWGRESQSWTGDFQTHPGAGFYRNLLGVQIERVLSDTDAVLSQRLRLGRTQDTRRIERLYFVELLRSRKSEFNAASESVSSAAALTANAHLVLRNLDSVLLPTRGLTLALQGGLGQATSGRGDNGPLGRLYGRLTGYLPLGQRWYGQARLEAGQVFKPGGVDYPDALGFRAGGDDSVRGYSYRSLAPKDAAGNPVSGQSLLTASVELARPVSDSLPQVWGAVFLDAGRAVNDWGDYKPALGYGAGVRWRSPIGPLRMDLAWGQEQRQLKLHLSVGIAF